MAYDVDYFLKKFDDIPEEQWCTGVYSDVGPKGEDRQCAVGHCRSETSLLFSVEVEALRGLLKKVGLGDKANNSRVSDINDGRNPDFQQPTPKQRILAALKYVKEKPCTP